MLRSLKAPDRPVAIGEVRRRTGMTNRAIRFYEDKGLIRSGRDGRGQRRYDQAALERLTYIAHARQAGLQIADIRQLLSIADRDGEAQLAVRTQELYRARLAELEAQLEAVEASARALGFSLQPQRPQLVAL
ncbi:MAG: redox-sensitive transcriptional activator SoxR [Caulobacter sp.]|nr:redox-sensitive transcriptional activator SoxR [Caulobacter sp.]